MAELGRSAEVRAAAVRGWGPATAGLAVVVLLVRVASSVAEKPIQEDEAMAGLVSARPLSEVLDVVVNERGGSPLHFVLAHAALAAWPSPAGLRWLSIVFAAASVALCYDLGRRLGGTFSGVVAAFVAAASTAFLHYGAFGRMYALLAFSGALAVDLFVRAVQRPTRGTALAAAGGAWLLPAVHPFGWFAVGAEALVALALWRGRTLRAAVPVAAVGALALPLLLSHRHLADRYGVGEGRKAALAEPLEAWVNLPAKTFAGFAGGDGAFLVGCFVLAAIGLVALFRRLPAVAALTCLTTLMPGLVLTAAQTGSSSPSAVPRHFMFALPLCAGVVGVGAARVVERLPSTARPAALGALVALLLAAPAGGIPDPTRATFDRVYGGEFAREAPARWVAARLEEGDVIFKYTAVWLEALPRVRNAHVVAAGQGLSIRRSLERVGDRVHSVFVGVPVGNRFVDRRALAASLPPQAEVGWFPRWVLIRVTVSARGDAGVLTALYRAAAAAESATRQAPFAAGGVKFFDSRSLCRTLRRVGGTCRGALGNREEQRGEHPRQWPGEV